MRFAVKKARDSASYLTASRLLSKEDIIKAREEKKQQKKVKKEKAAQKKEKGFVAFASQTAQFVAKKAGKPLFDALVRSPMAPVAALERASVSSQDIVSRKDDFTKAVGEVKVVADRMIDHVKSGVVHAGEMAKQALHFAGSENIDSHVEQATQLADRLGGRAKKMVGQLAHVIAPPIEPLDSVKSADAAFSSVATVLALAGSGRAVAESGMGAIASFMAKRNFDSWSTYLATQGVSTGKVVTTVGALSMLNQAATLLNVCALIQEAPPIVESVSALTTFIRNPDAAGRKYLDELMKKIIPPSEAWPTDNFPGRLALYKKLLEGVSASDSPSDEDDREEERGQDARSLSDEDDREEERGQDARSLSDEDDREEERGQDARSFTVKMKEAIWNMFYDQALAQCVKATGMVAGTAGATIAGMGFRRQYSLANAGDDAMVSRLLGVTDDLYKCLFDTAGYCALGATIETAGGYLLGNAAEGIVAAHLQAKKGDFLGAIEESMGKLLQFILFNPEEKPMVDLCLASSAPDRLAQDDADIKSLSRAEADIKSLSRAEAALLLDAKVDLPPQKLNSQESARSLSPSVQYSPLEGALAQKIQEKRQSETVVDILVSGVNLAAPLFFKGKEVEREPEKSFFEDPGAPIRKAAEAHPIIAGVAATVGTLTVLAPPVTVVVGGVAMMGLGIAGYCSESVRHGMKTMAASVVSTATDVVQPIRAGVGYVATSRAANVAYSFAKTVVGGKYLLPAVTGVGAMQYFLSGNIPEAAVFGAASVNALTGGRIGKPIVQMVKGVANAPGRAWRFFRGGTPAAPNARTEQDGSLSSLKKKRS